MICQEPLGTIELVFNIIFHPEKVLIVLCSFLLNNIKSRLFPMVNMQTS